MLEQAFNGSNDSNGNKQTVPQQEILSENLEPKYKEILQNIVKAKNNNSSNGSNSRNNQHVEPINKYNREWH